MYVERIHRWPEGVTSYVCGVMPKDLLIRSDLCDRGHFTIVHVVVSLAKIDEKSATHNLASPKGGVPVLQEGAEVGWTSDVETTATSVSLA